MLPRSLQKTLRLYRNRFWAAVSTTDPHPPPSDVDYRPRFGYSYGYSYGGSAASGREPNSRRRRVKRRHAATGGVSVSSPLVLLSAVALFVVASVAANILLPPASRRKMWRIFGVDVAHGNAGPHGTNGHGGGWRAVASAQWGAKNRHNSRIAYIGGGQPHTSPKTRGEAVAASQLQSYHASSPSSSSKSQMAHIAIAPVAHVVPTVPTAAQQLHSVKSPHQEVHNQPQAQAKTTGQSMVHDDSYTRTCYTNPTSRNAVCVHVPMCMRHSSIVYLSDVLRCAAYTNTEHRDVTMSQSRCLELERSVEMSSQMLPVERKTRAWLDDLAQRDSVLWFEGDTVLFRLSYRCTSIAHFAARIFMLHHMLQHPSRYGLGTISNVVVAAHETVAKKLRYSKSWHHGLLVAVVYPHALLYTHAAVEAQLAARKGKGADGKMTVFVSDGMWGVAKSRRVPCFRRVAVGTPSQQQLFLTAETYPGVLAGGGNNIDEEVRTADAGAFRKMVYASLGISPAPALSKRIVYLHRATTRTFSTLGLTTFQVTLRTLCETRGFSFRLLDMAGLSFSQQVSAIGDAGIAVGVHGTQMLNGLFVAGGAAVLEVMPYGFKNDMMAGGSGAAQWYATYRVASGVDFAGLGKFGGDVDKCRRQSSDCKRWYQSDDRAIDFSVADATAISKLMQDAMDHVEKTVGKT